ncbi:MAG: CotS family spore coat protein [Lachnospiraceae bacterium]|nr:CotS family spore coat protein [Lachnospiraceae bacterium]
MNDRAVSLLENYDIEVLRTWKGRGAILCESNKGILIFKEYSGPREKVLFQNVLLNHVTEQGGVNVENIIKNKEGQLLVDDQDGISYILKTYFEGRECNVRDMEECRMAVHTLAALHKASDLTNTEIMAGKTSFQVVNEYEKHNKELKKVRKFLKEKSQKTDFEIYLMKSYDYFYNLALQVTEELYFYTKEAGSTSSGLICHGDYQYHNILLSNNRWSLINFEKCIIDNPVRDLYLFMRKLLEKSNWSQTVGDTLLSAYIAEREMVRADHIQLFYRLSYPEKFWKIVNFYYNSGKAWIPGKNLEKLEKLMDQEKDKQLFLTNYRSNYRLL